MKQISYYTRKHWIHIRLLLRDTVSVRFSRFSTTCLEQNRLIEYSKILFIFLLLFNAMQSSAQNSKFIPSEHAVIQTQRNDNRYLSTLGSVHALLRNTTPKCAFNPNMNLAQLQTWQKELRQAMAEIMQHPNTNNQPPPVCISSEKRNGYLIEKWEFYPLPETVSTFLVLLPNKVKKNTPAVMCIPGSGQTKEYLAGEMAVSKNFGDSQQDPKRAMALDYVKAGVIAVVVDNAAAGEASDLEEFELGTRFQYELTARYLLELGWSYLGYTSYLNKMVLEWMKNDKRINPERIIVSGFSLGTEPLMVLATLDTSIFAFVYNDFLCNTQERAIVMTKPDERGIRSFPNSIRHLIPNFWRYFNFPDIVAAIAPRPLILTEGGLDRDLNLVLKAYEITGHPEKIEIHHYKKFAKKNSRSNLDKLHEGMGRDEYYQSVNVDSNNHYFKYEVVIPWLNQLLKANKTQLENHE